VEVGDGSPHLPAPRNYAATSGTGRGLAMLESMVDDWGVTRRPNGKFVWFLLSNADRSSDGHDDTAVRHTDSSGPPRVTGQTVAVDLLNMPLLLHAAWQEHVEALLREYLLANLDADGQESIQRHADAADAIAVLEEHTPRSRAWNVTDELFANATEPVVSASVRVPVPVTSVPHFDTLDRVVEAAAALAEDGQVLTPPIQPAVDDFRRWLCNEVLGQSEGGRPQPWEVPSDGRHAPVLPPNWDATSVVASGRGLIAANSSSQIIAVSPEAAAILGYDDPDELIGRRIVSIVPPRLRQAHVAGFTMYLLVGRRPIMKAPAVVPALRGDGSEVLVELVVSEQRKGENGSFLLADIRLARDPDLPSAGTAG
jgi:PAS domain S-box-containing protein